MSFLRRPNYENPADHDEDNVYGVAVVATDASGMSTTKEVTVTVLDVNDPNVVFIMADDVGYEAFGAYGSTQYSTRRLDEIARKGVRFTNAFSLPMCAPTGSP